MPLVYVDDASGPVLTVENYLKWYQLFLVHKEVVTPIYFHELEPFAAEMGCSAFVDHVPNPRVVEVFAEAKGFGLDGQAWEMMLGRWTWEVEGK
jgi:hypothetical protein